MTVPPAVVAMFRQAGWHADRAVPVPGCVPPQHPAFAVLTMFGGLRVGEVGPGENCARSDLVFQFVVDFDDAPTWSQRLSTVLVGVALVHHEHVELYVDSEGRCFTASLNDVFCLAGLSVGDAFEVLLLGRRLRPLLPPGAVSVQAYGEEYGRGDPRLFDWP